MYLSGGSDYYLLVEEVKKDLELIRENCRLYCSLTFPGLVEAAEKLCEEAVLMMKELGAEVGG
jgi:hypothetical protein